LGRVASVYVTDEEKVVETDLHPGLELQVDIQGIPVLGNILARQLLEKVDNALVHEVGIWCGAWPVLSRRISGSTTSSYVGCKIIYLVVQNGNGVLLAGQCLDVLGWKADVAFKVVVLEHELLFPPPVGPGVVCKVSKVMVPCVQVCTAHNIVLASVVCGFVAELNRVVDRAVLAVAKSRYLDWEYVGSVESRVLLQRRLRNDVWIVAREEAAEIVDGSSDGNIRAVAFLPVK